MQKGIPGKKDRISASDRIGRFEDLAGRIDIAGIDKLSKSDPNAAYVAAQRLEQELLQEEAAHYQQAAQLDQDMGSQSENEMKTEKGLELQAQLPFQKKQQLQSLQQLKMEIENELRARHSATPRPRAGG